MLKLENSIDGYRREISIESLISLENSIYDRIVLLELYCEIDKMYIDFEESDLDDNNILLNFVNIKEMEIDNYKGDISSIVKFKRLRRLKLNGIFICLEKLYNIDELILGERFTNYRSLDNIRVKKLVIERDINRVIYNFIKHINYEELEMKGINDIKILCSNIEIWYEYYKNFMNNVRNGKIYYRLGELKSDIDCRNLLNWYKTSIRDIMFLDKKVVKKLKELEIDMEKRRVNLIVDELEYLKNMLYIDGRILRDEIKFYEYLRHKYDIENEIREFLIKNGDTMDICINILKLRKLINKGVKMERYKLYLDDYEYKYNNNLFNIILREKYEKLRDKLRYVL